LARGSVSLDFVFASLIFIIILGFSIVSYSNSIEQIKNNNVRANLESDVFSISQILVKSGGTPTYWENNPGSVEVVGLAQSDNVLSIEKVDAFSTLNENETRGSLGITSDFFIQIESIDGVLFFTKGEELINSSSVSIERIVYYNQSVCKLVVRLYE
jgi:hypothetical protein